ncbi:MAG: methyltransferase domain-containing protein [Pseudomonadota bacterium]|nr:methyltransferase domain-containing protein [Pseudomonadota bacterium]
MNLAQGRNPATAGGAAEAHTITDAEFARFQALIFKIAGISLGDAKKMLLTGRLAKRLKARGVASYTEYCKLVTAAHETVELQTMVDLLTTNETYFFREEKHFEFLDQAILARHPAGRPFNIWSAACSSGEEVYTLAMVLAERLGVNGNWTVTGSDISQRVLASAEGGLYPLSRTTGIPPEYLRKYCLKGVRSQEGTLLIDDTLRRHTRFLQVNLNQPLPELGPFDVIFLRNVMIYFNAETKRDVVARLVQRLKPGGHFIVGHSESLNGLNETLRPLRPTIYIKP